MQQNLDKIFESHDCLSEEQLINYAQDKLNQSEKHQLEKHLVDCDFCSAAVEGYQKMGSQKDVVFLQNEIDQKTAGKKNNKGIIWMVAASLALLIGLSTTLFNSKDSFENKVAEADTKETKQEEISEEVESKSNGNMQVTVIDSLSEINNEYRTESRAAISDSKSITQTDVSNNYYSLEINEDSNDEDIESDNIASDYESGYSSDPLELDEENEITTIEKEGKTVVDGSFDDLEKIESNAMYSNTATNQEAVTIDAKKSNSKIARSDVKQLEKERKKSDTKDKEANDKYKSEAPTVSAEIIVTDNVTMEEVIEKPAVSEHKELEKSEDVLLEQNNSNYSQNVSDKEITNSNDFIYTLEEKDYESTLKLDVNFDSLSAKEQDSLGLEMSEAEFDQEYQIGVDYYQKKNYQVAIEYLERTVTGNKQNYYASIYMGLSYMEIENYPKAIKMFDHVIKNGPKELREEAKLHKAKALIKTDKKEDAKKLLNEIILLDGKFKNDAQILLETLN